MGLHPVGGAAGTADHASSRTSATCRRSRRSTADPAIVDFKNPFFSDAPVGKIFSDTAKNLTPQYLGKKSGQVRVAVENVLRKVEQGKTSGDAAWQEAVKEAQKAATA